MNFKSWMLAPVALCILTACGAEEEPSRLDATPTGSTTQARTDETAERESPGLYGHVQFSVDGVERSFEFIAADHTHYHRLGSKIHAQPSRNSQETATIIFMNVDLKAVDYPVELPLPRGVVDPEKPMMSMITIGFGYIDREGNEWAGPGRLRLESVLADGTVSGSFTDVSLPHTEKELPNIVLQDGRFTVGLWAR